MVSVKVASIAGAVAVCSRRWQMRPTCQSLPPVSMPPVEEFSASGWYLRGDIGMTNQQFKGLHQRLYDVPGTTVEAVGMGWDSSTFFGLGIGYKFNDWFRADMTGEYRGKANFHGSDNVTFTGGQGVDNYSGSKSEWVFLANAYVDLGTWWCVTPYIGAGIGMANIKIRGFRDDGFNYIWWRAHNASPTPTTPQMEFRLGAARRRHLQGDAVDEHRSRLPLHRSRQRHDRRRRARSTTASPTAGRSPSGTSPRTTSSSASAGCSSRRLRRCR